MSNIEGLSKGVKLVSIEFNTAVKYVTRQGFVNDFPITFEYTFKEYLRTFVRFKQRDDFSVVKVDGVDCVRFTEDLDVGVPVTIRRITPSGAVPHVYQYTGNAQGGAEFSAKTIDENFEYLSGIVEEVEEYNSITMDSLSGLEDSFGDVKVIADEAKAASEDALEFAGSALEVAEGIDSKAQLALDTSKVAQEDAANALNIAQGVDGKAQTALDTSKDALLNSKEALQTAQGVDGKAQEALDKATSAELNAKVAVETSAQVDGKAQEALDNSVNALLDISKKRDISDTHFNSALRVQASDSAGTGMFLMDGEGTVRGQVVSNSYGLQFTQVQEDGSHQTFTFPRCGEGGEIALVGDTVAESYKEECLKIELIAHRGFRGIYTQNTIGAFINSTLHPLTDAIEMDIQVTSDGVPVVFHDKNAKALTGVDAEIVQTPYKEVESLRYIGKYGESAGDRLPIPSLEAVLEAIPRKNIPIYPEVKHVRGVGDIKTIVKMFHDNYPTELINWQSFDLGHLEEILKIDGEAKTMYLISSGSESTVQENIDSARQAGCFGVLVKYSLILEYPNLVKYCESNHLILGVWTVNNPEDISKLLRLGVTRIMSDYPFIIN